MAILKPEYHKKIKHFKFSCIRCFFNCVDDELRMKEHCLKSHGDTGKFSKAYTKKQTFKKIK